VKASRSRGGQPLLAKVSRSIARRVLERRETMLLPNLMEDTAFSTQDSILSTGIRSALCAPLWFTSASAEQDAVIGLVYLDTLAMNRPFTEEDARIVTALANVAAAKIENVRLLEESMEKRRLEDDMRVAAEIQRGLLPDGAPTVTGYGVVGSNRPCRTVGGDYYDFLLSEGRLLMALGDVSGKGTGAALLMTVLRAAVRGHWADESVAEAVGRINSTVCQNVTAGKYITFFLARLEPASGRVDYVNAGHNPPLLFTAGQAQPAALTRTGMAMGVFPGVTYEQRTVQLAPGDWLFLYTDGVTDAVNAAEQRYDQAQLLATLTRQRQLSADEILAGLDRSLRAFVGDQPPFDDITMVLLKRR
jgi:serine phosphatase RsbU (regulator of sigma subunit)